MEGSNIVQLRKFVRNALNLSDAAKLGEFSVYYREGIVEVKAQISLDIAFEDLSKLSKTVQVEEKNPSMRLRKKGAGRKASSEGEYSLNREFRIDSRDFHIIRVLLRGWRRTGRLNENEVQFMVENAGKRFDSMPMEEKKLFLDTFLAIRARLQQKDSLEK